MGTCSGFTTTPEEIIGIRKGRLLHAPRLPHLSSSGLLETLPDTLGRSATFETPFCPTGCARVFKARAAFTRGARSLATRSKFRYNCSNASLHLQNASAAFGSPVFAFAMSIGVRRRPAVERPRSLRRQLRRPSLILRAKRLSHLPKSCTALWLGFGLGAPWRPYLLSMRRFRLFARGAPRYWLCRAELPTSGRKGARAFGQPPSARVARAASRRESLGALTNTLGLVASRLE